MTTLAQVFAEARQLDMTMLGPQAWTELHAWAERFRSQVGDSCGCGEFAVMATRALHDVVSVRLGKKAMYPENLHEMAKVYQEAASHVEMNQAAPFGWPGGKRILKHRIIALIPPHKTYVEPFAGAASVFWAKEPSEVEVLNDIDPDLMRFYRNIGDVAKCDTARVSKGWDSLKTRQGELAPCEFFSAVKCSFGQGGFARGQARDHEGCQGGHPHFHKALPEYQARLAQTKLHNEDWQPVVRRYDASDTFFYLDPPYHGTSRRYAGGGDQDVLPRLAQVLPGLKGKWLLSCDDHPDVRAAFQGSHIRKLNSRYTIAAGDNNHVAKELLISNYVLRGAAMKQYSPARFEAIRKGAGNVLSGIAPLLAGLAPGEMLMPEGLLLQVMQYEAQNINLLSAVLEFSPTLKMEQVAGHQRLPLGTPAQQERLERCIQEVKAKGGKANPWAACQASLGCRHRRVVTQSGIEPWPEGMFDEEDEDEEEEGDMEQEDLAIGGRVGKHGNVHPAFFPSEHAAQARKRELEAEPSSLPRHVEVHKWPAAWEPVEGVDSWVVVWWMESQPHLSQSFIDTILHTVVGTATATVVAKALNPGPSNIKEGEKPQDASPATPVPSVLSPAHVEGDQANVDLGTLLAELDAILKKPETMGIVDADTLTIVRE